MLECLQVLHGVPGPCNIAALTRASQTCCRSRISPAIVVIPEVDNNALSELVRWHWDWQQLVHTNRSAHEHAHMTVAVHQLHPHGLHDGCVMVSPAAVGVASRMVAAAAMLATKYCISRG